MEHLVTCHPNMAQQTHNCLYTPKEREIYIYRYTNGAMERTANLLIQRKPLFEGHPNSWLNFEKIKLRSCSWNIDSCTQNHANDIGNHGAFKSGGTPRYSPELLGCFGSFHQKKYIQLQKENH